MAYYLAVIVATIVSMIIGFAWYSKSLFGTAWLKQVGMTEAKIKKANMKKSMALGILSSLVMAAVFACFLSKLGKSTLAAGALTGFCIWLGFLATTLLGSVAWEQKSWKLYFINAGYHLVNLVIMGIVLSILI